MLKKRPRRVSVAALKLARIAIAVIWLLLTIFLQPGKKLIIIMAVFVLFFVLSVAVKEE